MKKSKGAKVVSMPSTPEAYFKSGRARKLPIHECRILDDWEYSGFTIIILSRRHANGNLSWGVFYVDTFCQGVRQSGYCFNLPLTEYEDFKEGVLEGFVMEPAEYVLAHSLIYGSIDYARPLGFEPNKDFNITQYILEEREKVKIMDLPFGKDGRPLFISNPDASEASIKRVLGTLERTVGKGNFDFIRGEELEEDDLRDEDDEDDEWDEDEDDEWDDDDEGELIFEEGELEEILEGKKTANMFQLFAITEMMFEESFPEELESFENETYDPDIEDMLEQATEDEDKYYSAPKEMDYFIDNMPKRDTEDIDLLINNIEEGISKFPNVYMLYEIRLLLAQFASKPVPKDLFEGFYRLFPGEPLTKLLKAYHLVLMGEPERAFEIINRKYRMQDAFPERKGIFSFDEIFMFCALMCRYYTAIDQLGAACIFGNLILENTEEEEETIVNAALPYLIEKMGQRITMQSNQNKA